MVPCAGVWQSFLQNGQIVVAAHSNSGAYTVPACLMGVLGVVTDEGLNEEFLYTRDTGWEQVQIHASSRHILPVWEGSCFEPQVSNSYAAPLVTAKVHEILCETAGKPQTVAEVYRRLTGQGSTMFRMRPDFVEDAVLFQAGEKRLQQEPLFFFREGKGRKPGGSAGGSKPKSICAGCAPAFGKPGSGLGGMQLLPGDLSAGFPVCRGNVCKSGSCRGSFLGCWTVPEIFDPRRPYAYLYGMEYLPDGVEPERFAVDVAALRQASVVVYCLGGREGQEEPEYDFRIMVGGCRGIRMEGENIWLAEIHDKLELEELYKYVLMYVP